MNAALCRCVGVSAELSISGAVWRLDGAATAAAAAAAAATAAAAADDDDDDDDGIARWRCF